MSLERSTFFIPIFLKERFDIDVVGFFFEKGGPTRQPGDNRRRHNSSFTYVQCVLRACNPLFKLDLSVPS